MGVAKIHEKKKKEKRKKEKKRKKKKNKKQKTKEKSKKNQKVCFCLIKHECVKKPAVGEKVYMKLKCLWLSRVSQSPSSPASSTVLVGSCRGI